MQIEQKKLTVLRFYEQVVNRADTEVARSIVSESLLLPLISSGEVTGPDGVLVSMEEVKEGFPDCFIRVLGLSESGEDIIATIHTTGCNVGTYKGIEPSRKIIAVQSNIKFKFENNMIISIFLLHPADPDQLNIGFIPTLESAIAN